MCGSAHSLVQVVLNVSSCCVQWNMGTLPKKSLLRLLKAQIETYLKPVQGQLDTLTKQLTDHKAEMHSTITSMQQRLATLEKRSYVEVAAASERARSEGPPRKRGVPIGPARASSVGVDGEVSSDCKATLFFTSSDTAQHVLLWWRRSVRQHQIGGVDHVIYAGPRLSRERAREEYLWRMLARFTATMPLFQAGKLERDRSSLSMFYDQQWLAGICNGVGQVHRGGGGIKAKVTKASLAGIPLQMNPTQSSTMPC